MLHAARTKLTARGERRVPLLAADALALPFADKTFACVTSAFLLRNLADLPVGLAEMRRVTVPGGLVAALEITRPGVPGWDALFGLYFNRLVPLVGAAVARDRAAYPALSSPARPHCSARPPPATGRRTPTCRNRSSASSPPPSWRA